PALRSRLLRRGTGGDASWMTDKGASDRARGAQTEACQSAGERLACVHLRRLKRTPAGLCSKLLAAVTRSLDRSRHVASQALLRASTPPSGGRGRQIRYLAAGRIVLGDDVVERCEDVGEMRARERHGLDAGEIQRAIRSNQEYARL